jgi:hypothetical protein
VGVPLCPALASPGCAPIAVASPRASSQIDVLWLDSDRAFSLIKPL